MTTFAQEEGKILILATESCAYPGANSVGQAHSTYPPNTYIMRVRAPVLFPEGFYMDCFKKGISGIIIMSCGEECPYEGAYHALSKRIDRVYQMMRLCWKQESWLWQMLLWLCPLTDLTDRLSD